MFFLSVITGCNPKKHSGTSPFDGITDRSGLSAALDVFTVDKSQNVYHWLDWKINWSTFAKGNNPSSALYEYRHDYSWKQPHRSVKDSSRKNECRIIFPVVHVPVLGYTFDLRTTNTASGFILRKNTFLPTEILFIRKTAYYFHIHGKSL